MPRTSLSALEILLRQVEADRELDAYPLVRANLKTFIRSLQRQKLDQGLQDIAVGRVLNRRFMLLLVPSGGLKSPEAMGLVVRVEEQNAKGNSALRRRGRAVPTAGGPKELKPVPTAAARVQDDDDTDAADAVGGE